jgi:HSP20 family protein
MKKFFIYTSAGLVLVSGAAFANNIPTQHDSIPIDTQQDQAVQDQMDMTQHFNNLFNSFFGSALSPDNPVNGSNFIPLRRMGFSAYARTDMYETKDNIKINIDMPGVKKDDIDLEIAGNIISIKYQQKEQKNNKDKDYSLNERSYGSFERQFTLPANADTDKAVAKYEDGVLRISIPKLSEARVKAKKIDID